MKALTMAVLASLALLTAASVLPALAARGGSDSGSLQTAPSGVTVTRADDGTTIRLGVGDRFLVKLGSEFEWTVSVKDQAVVRRVPNIAIVAGAQGVYEALKAGQTELSATGMVPCAPGQPCPLLLAVFGVLLDVEPVPPGSLMYAARLPALSRDGAAEVTGQVLAGPTCPVERIPPDPRCAPRPVSGAVLLFIDDFGREAGRAVSGDDGQFTISLPAGRYTLTPQPVVGLLGTAPPQEVTVTSAGAHVTVLYDTGIR